MPVEAFLLEQGRTQGKPKVWKTQVQLHRHQDKLKQPMAGKNNINITK